MIMRRLMDIFEAVGPADFPYLLGDEINRRLQRAYAEVPTAYAQYCTTSEVADFKNQDIINIESDEDLDRLIGRQEYRSLEFVESKKSYRVYRYGKMLSVEWEMVVNDDLRAINRMTDIMGRRAKRAVAKFAASLLASSPADDTIKGDLDFANLSAAITAMGERTAEDSDDPLGISADLLVIPKYWELTAKALLRSTELRGKMAGLYGNANPLEGALELAVDPFLPGRDWYVMAGPSQAEAIELSFLRGYRDKPKLLKRRGDEEGEDMDFYTDTIDYKVRHVFGGVLNDENGILHVGPSGA